MFHCHVDHRHTSLAVENLFLSFSHIHTYAHHIHTHRTHILGTQLVFNVNEQKYRANATLRTKEITTLYVYLYHGVSDPMKYSKHLLKVSASKRRMQKEKKIISSSCIAVCIACIIIIIKSGKKRVRVTEIERNMAKVLVAL